MRGVCRAWLIAIGMAMGVGIVVLGGARLALADIVESFEGPDPSWTLAESDCQASLAVQQRRLSGAHSGQGCEFLRVTMAQGTRVYLAHKIPPSSLITEWQPSVWVKSDRPGLQMLVRVVFPRTIDRRNGQPMTTLLGGSTYQDVGAWQQLTLVDPLELLDRQVRVLRTQWDQPIDPRQAYADLIVINAHGGASVTNLWVDDLDLRGFVQARGAMAVEPWRASDPPGAHGAENLERGGAAATALTEARHGRFDLDVRPAATWTTDRSWGGSSDQPPLRRSTGIRVQGSLLMVGQQPLMPRVVRWRGEPFDWLKELGFNTLLLSQPATPQQQLEAAQRDLWLVCPPPASFDMGDGNGFDRVIAWNLGTQLGQGEREATRERARNVRRLDPLADRPVLCGGDGDLDGYSRVGDILSSCAWSRLGRSNLSESGRELSAEVRHEMRRSGPMWAEVLLPRPLVGDDQPLDFARLRTARSGHSRDIRETHEGDRSVSGKELIDVRWAVYQALADGVRGVILSPSDSLEPGRDESRPLLNTVRTLNEELKLIEPWVLSESGVENARASDPRYRVRMLENPRARLAIVMREPTSNDDIAGDFGGRNKARFSLPDSGVSFVDTGTHGAADAYEITPSGLKRLRRKRVTGGVEVALDHRPALTLVVLTSEPLVVSYLSRNVIRRP